MRRAVPKRIRVRTHEPAIVDMGWSRWVRFFIGNLRAGLRSLRNVAGIIRRPSRAVNQKMTDMPALSTQSRPGPKLQTTDMAEGW